MGKDGVIGGLSDGAPLLTQAFTTDEGRGSGRRHRPATAIAIFVVTDVKPAHAPEFATAKPLILNDYRSDQKAPALLATETTKLADRAKVLNDLKKAAAEMNLPYKSSDLVGQDAQVPDVGSMGGEASVAFTLAKGAISGAINAGATGVVLAVTDKQEPSADDMAKNFDTTREQLLGDQREEIFQVFTWENLSQEAPPERRMGYPDCRRQPAPPPGGLPGGPPGNRFLVAAMNGPCSSPCVVGLRRGGEQAFSCWLFVARC